MTRMPVKAEDNPPVDILFIIDLLTAFVDKKSATTT